MTLTARILGKLAATVAAFAMYPFALALLTIFSLAALAAHIEKVWRK